MLGYVTLGTNDLDKAVGFYDGVLSILGAKQVMNDGRMVMYRAESAGMLGICTPFDEQPANRGNGVMVALDIGTRAAADQVYAKAMELGARDEGAPGPRGTGGFYGGYFRDLDGNKVLAYCFGG